MLKREELKINTMKHSNPKSGTIDTKRGNTNITSDTAGTKSGTTNTEKQKQNAPKIEDESNVSEIKINTGNGNKEVENVPEIPLATSK